MFLRLALLFVAVPLAELVLLVWIGKQVGLGPTVGLVVVTGILGAALARAQGSAAWKRFRAALDGGRPPHRELVEGLLVLVAGAVLLTPGLITDLAGFALLLPPFRRRVAGFIVERLTRRFTLVGPGGRPVAGGRRGDAVDVDFRVVDAAEAEYTRREGATSRRSPRLQAQPEPDRRPGETDGGPEARDRSRGDRHEKDDR